MNDPPMAGRRNCPIIVRSGAIVTEFHNVGDIVIVPDGPKPLILAASLIPMRMGVPGVLCFHVTRRKGQNYQPVDVKPIGEPFGLSFVGKKGSVNGPEGSQSILTGHKRLESL